MSLEKKERLILANQYRILALIDQENADQYAHWREALEYGYPSAYMQVFDDIYDGLSEEECIFVVDVLSMYEALQNAHRKYGEEFGTAAAVAFPGFDGNNETPFMTYARFIREKEGRFDYLTVAEEDLNSHFTSLAVYERMLEVWRKYDESLDLTIAAARDVLNARIHPTRRAANATADSFS